jgi:hypothetical protein
MRRSKTALQRSYPTEMNIFSWFSGGEVNEFARSLATTLAKRYPPAIDVNPAKKVSENRLTRVLDEAFTEAMEFQQQRKLGFYGKAKLGAEFKWQLKELGYSDKFIDVATEGLMVYITRGKRPEASV